MLTLEATRWTWFTVVDIHRSAQYEEIYLECHRCGHQFLIDTETELNMIYLADEWVPQCPECNQVGE